MFAFPKESIVVRQVTVVEFRVRSTHFPGADPGIEMSIIM
jgi:hypothetical protein